MVGGRDWSGPSGATCHHHADDTGGAAEQEGAARQGGVGVHEENRHGSRGHTHPEGDQQRSRLGNPRGQSPPHQEPEDEGHYKAAYTHFDTVAVTSAGPDEYSARFGGHPELVVSVPGRVNLIGEHTDYALLPVMPAAIDRHLTLAVAGSDRFDLHAQGHPPLLGDVAEVGWQRYVRGVVDELGEEGGLRGVIVSTLPSTGGLSSSTALSMALVVAISETRGLHLTRDRVVEATVAAERRAGVESGEMDQIVIAHGREGHSLRIDFHPVPTRRPVPLPDDLALVVAYSGEPAEKGGAARYAYNRCVVASRLAAALLGAPSLAAVSSESGAGDLPVAASAAEVADMTGMDMTALAGLRFGMFPTGEKVPVRVAASHAFGEAERVEAAEACLLAADGAGLGRLLDKSQASLVSLGVSTPSLGALVAAMREAGGHGARLTGAGFGGNAVAVCPPGRVASVVAAAVAVTGGPAFRVHSSDGYRIRT